MSEPKTVRVTWDGMTFVTPEGLVHIAGDPSLAREIEIEPIQKVSVEGRLSEPDTDARADRIERIEAELAELRRRVTDLEDYRKHVDEVLAGDDW